MLAFALLERRQLARAELPTFLARLSFCQSVNARYLQHSNERLAHWLVRDLVRSGAVRESDGMLLAV